MLFCSSVRLKIVILLTCTMEPSQEATKKTKPTQLMRLLIAKRSECRKSDKSVVKRRWAYNLHTQTHSQNIHRLFDQSDCAQIKPLSKTEKSRGTRTVYLTHNENEMQPIKSD